MERNLTHSASKASVVDAWLSTCENLELLSTEAGLAR